jgi:hypothetical protein
MCLSFFYRNSEIQLPSGREAAKNLIQAIDKFMDSYRPNQQEDESERIAHLVEAYELGEEARELCVRILRNPVTESPSRMESAPG